MKKLLYTMSLATLYALAVTAEDAQLLSMNSAACAPEDMSGVLASSDSSDSDPVEAAPVQADSSLALKIALDSRESIQGQIEELTIKIVENASIEQADIEMLKSLMTVRSTLQQVFEDQFIKVLTANELAQASAPLDKVTTSMMQNFSDLMSQRATIQAQVEQAVVGALAPQAAAVSDDSDSDSDEDSAPVAAVSDDDADSEDSKEDSKEVSAQGFNDFFLEF